MHHKHLLAHTGKVSLYTDSIDNPGFVCIEVAGNETQRSRGSVTIQIPAAVWEEIRHKSAVLYDLADIPDEELRKRAQHCALSWKGLERLLKPYAAPFKALCGMKRAYHLPTEYATFLRELKAQRNAQRKLRESLDQLKSKTVKTGALK
ncbi:MAG: hypothetical protein IPP19_03860 [Verrucomicrobia bacterium]|nr:hypothetical protein [Verrucomicrobiota bacterium]